MNVLIAYAAVMAWGGRGVDSPNYRLSLSQESRYEDASLCYTGIESHTGLPHVGLYDTVVAKE